MAIEREKTSCAEIAKSYSRGLLAVGMPEEVHVLDDCRTYFRDDPDAAAGAIFGLLVRGQFELGELLLTKVRLEGIRDVVARNYLAWGEARNSGEDVASIEEKLRVAANKAGQDYLIKNAVAHVLATGEDFQAAIELLESVDDAYPAEPFHLRLLTIAYFRTGDIGRAADAGYRALAAAPDLDSDAPFMASLSWSMAAGGQRETAVAILDRLLTQNPDASNRPIVIRYRQWLAEKRGQVLQSNKSSLIWRDGKTPAHRVGRRAVSRHSAW